MLTDNRLPYNRIRRSIFYYLKILLSPFGSALPIKIILLSPVEKWILRAELLTILAFPHGVGSPDEMGEVADGV